MWIITIIITMVLIYPHPNFCPHLQASPSASPGPTAGGPQVQKTLWALDDSSLLVRFINPFHRQRFFCLTEMDGDVLTRARDISYNTQYTITWPNAY